MQQCDQGIFVEWFGGLAVFFGGERRGQQFARHALGDDIDGHTAGNLPVVVTTQAIGDNEYADGSRERFVDALQF